MKRHQLILLVAFAFIRCNSGSEGSISLKIDTLRVKTSTNYLVDYQTRLIVDDTFVGYNHTTHTFDFISLKNDGNTKIYLEEVGPNGVKVASFNLDGDKIITSNRKGIKKLLKSTGQVIESYRPMGPGIDKYSTSTPLSYTNGYSELCYDTIRNCIFYPLFKAGKYVLEDIAYYQLSDSSLYRLEVENIEFINNNMGILSPPFFSLMGNDRLMLSTFYSDSVFIINAATGKLLEKLRLSSSIRSGSSPPIKTANLKELDKHYVVNRRYGNVLKIDNYYARVVYEKDREAMFDGSGQYFVLFDEDGRTLNEFQLDTSVKPILMKWKDSFLLLMESAIEEEIVFLQISPEIV